MKTWIKFTRMCVRLSILKGKTVFSNVFVYLKHYISKKNLCVTNIGFSAPARIYVNENLTKKNFEIFRLARQLKVDGKIFQYNTFSGRVFIKLAADSQNIGIDSKNQLHSNNFFRLRR